MRVTSSIALGRSRSSQVSSRAILTQFEQLPVEAKTAVYERLWAILSGKDTSDRYRHLSAADRRAIIEILRATRQDLPTGFRG